MIEELVSFEIAKLAKEKGFYDLYAGFTIDGKLIPMQQTAQFIEDIYYSAPTQSLLQKWLREVHNIWVEPKIYDGPTQREKVFGYLILNTKWEDDEEVRFVETKAEWNTYELALEEGLKQALKLIEL